LFVSVALAMFPWPKFNNGVYPKIRAFFLRPRTSLIFTCFFSLTWFIVMIAMTVHSTNDSNCNLDEALIKKHSGYANAWKNQCNCAKTVAAFSWFLFFAWLGTAVCSAILLWHEKKQRHLEKNTDQQAKDQENHTVTSTAEYNEDAQTIVNEKDKESYLSGSPFSSRIEQDKQMSKAHSPVSDETSFMANGYSSPLAEVNTATYSPLIHEPTSPYSGVQNPVSTITAPFTPSNLMSPQQVPQVGFGSPQYPVSINDTVSSYPHSPYTYTSSPSHIYPAQQPYYPSHSSLPMNHQAPVVQQPENYQKDMYQ
ncbi:hypothetical protein CU098_010894, partial [Rhizopus stolonifer]